MASDDIAPPFGFGYAQLDRKIDIIERDFRADIAATNTKIDAVHAKIDTAVASIFDRLDRRDGIASLSKTSGGGSNRPSDPYQLILTAAAIIGGLGSAGAYVTSNLQAQMASNLDRTNAAMLVISDTLKKETIDRQDGSRRIYDAIQTTEARGWSRDAHAEFEKRIDQVSQMRHEFYVATMASLDQRVERTMASIVPRAEHEQQWKNDKEDLARVERQAAERADALSARLNATQLSYETKLSEVERVIHGYGISDEVKAMQDKLQSLTDKIFTIITAFVPKPVPGGSTDK